MNSERYEERILVISLADSIMQSPFAVSISQVRVIEYFTAHRESSDSKSLA